MKIECPCNCNLAYIGEPFKETRCSLCWHAANTPKYQNLWGIDPATLQLMTREQLAARPKPVMPACCGQSPADLEFEFPK